MSNSDLFHLQSGTDVRGAALQKDGCPPKTLGSDEVSRIARGFALWLKERTNKPEPLIGVGHDSRVTSEELAACTIKGLSAEGAKVADCGMSSTPSMFMGTVFPETDFDGAVVITASHMPMIYNGMKFFTKDGGLEKEDIRAVLEKAGGLQPCADTEASPVNVPLMEYYTASLRKRITDEAGMGGMPLEGLHIVTDAGNGTGGFFVKDVLEPLGADCSGSCFLDPDGTFPNHIPNPENKEAMAAIRSAVLSSRADLGLIFDTDADRMSAVLADGTEVNRDSIIAMMSAIIAPDYPGGTIVTDSVTSDRLTDFLEGLGLRHRRFRRGYRNVINEAIRLNSEGILTPLAIETSGHGALKENYFLDDGAYMAVKLVVAAAKMNKEGKRIDFLISALPPAVEEAERRIPISGDNAAAYGAEVLEAFRRRAEEKGICLAETCEGVRLSWRGEGWLLLRQSLHEPLLPLNAESSEKGGCSKLLDTAKELLEGFDRLDLSVL